MKKSYLIAAAGIGFLLMNNKSGGHEPPNERWYDVPGVGITPEGMLGSVGYVYMPEIEGYVKRTDLIANGWVLNNGVWDLPHGANTGDWMVLAGSVLTTVTGLLGGQGQNK